MKTRLFAAAILLAAGMSAAAPEFSEKPVRLWAGDAPLANGDGEHDIPTITPVLVADGSSSRAAVVVCPGGGYHALMDFEGIAYARWLNELGIHAFVLRYRLGSKGYRHPAMMLDAARAVRLVRARAAEWKVDPERLGIIGSSAGGHLASTLLTHFDGGDASAEDVVERQSSRPDLGILCYPVISFGEKGHRGSMRNLLGDNPSSDVVRLLSNELQVTARTPPTFLFHTTDDAVVKVENSLLFAEALARNGVPFALHIYTKGPHGIALGGRTPETPGRHPWTVECARWLKEQGF